MKMTTECGAGKQITGASFSLHPMSSNFIAIIVGVLEEVNTDKVWIKTDDITTTIRGKATHVFDVTKAIFVLAAATGEHIAFHATYSVGCPGDSDGDVYLAADDIPLNHAKASKLSSIAGAKFSLYPLGDGDYMELIYKQIEAMKSYVTVSPAHYSTRLDGDAMDVFKGLETVFTATAQAGSSHTVMTVSLSANSPTEVGSDKHA
ncbi:MULTISPECIES: YkoF family thiamine/hydroxymethylpyrimidine-binding protein [unclassified Virgibacillus]|uniref:YkoF family thiamine/hydroxymethylpyrimidine-binding protein n=1 Tax=unclassified Virgibacillus TaxID=2620237 RepID=UPI002ED85B50